MQKQKLFQIAYALFKLSYSNILISFHNKIKLVCIKSTTKNNLNDMIKII